MDGPARSWILCGCDGIGARLDRRVHPERSWARCRSCHGAVSQHTGWRWTLWDPGIAFIVGECGDTEILLEFDSGIDVQENTNFIDEPAAAWDALAKQDPSYTFVGTVLRQLAALIDPEKAGGEALGSVTFVEGNVWIIVVGNGRISLDDLRRVADSMRPADSGSVANT